MIKLNAFLLAEYAGQTADGRATIAGTFDTINFVRSPGVPEDQPLPVPMPQCYLVAITEASLADGLVHRLRFRVLNGNGEPIAEPTEIAIAYALNPHGRPMKNTLTLTLTGLVLPGVDDYVFELTGIDQPEFKAEHAFTVIDATGSQPPG